jgi:hypothetical protein
LGDNPPQEGGYQDKRYITGDSHTTFLHRQLRWVTQYLRKY